MQLRNFEDLYLHELGDLYDAERQLLEVYPKMQAAATSDELKEAFAEHMDVTKGQIERLDQIFDKLGRRPQPVVCEGMRGIIREVNSVIDSEGEGWVKDAALIGGAQRVEHYEIAGYGTAREFAQRMGHPEEANLLQETLDEESAADDKLTFVATETVNPEAEGAKGTEKEWEPEPEEEND